MSELGGGDGAPSGARVAEGPGLLGGTQPEGQLRRPELVIRQVGRRCPGLQRPCRLQP